MHVCLFVMTAHEAVESGKRDLADEGVKECFTTMTLVYPMSEACCRRTIRSVACEIRRCRPFVRPNVDCECGR